MKSASLQRWWYIPVLAMAIAGCEGCGDRPQETGEATVPPIPASEESAASSKLHIEDTVVGTGKEAVNGAKVSVHYVGKLLSGTTFDESTGKDPLTFELGSGRVIQGWEQGLLGMKVGGERILIIPPELAYGERGFGNIIPPNSTLVFEVKLVDVTEP